MRDPRWREIVVQASKLSPVVEGPLREDAKGVFERLAEELWKESEEHAKRQGWGEAQRREGVALHLAMLVLKGLQKQAQKVSEGAREIRLYE